MAYIKVWIHFVWTTKNYAPLLIKKEIRFDVFSHILNNARDKGIFIDHINGYKEHVHCLVSLGVDQTMKEIMQLIKGESSHWINKNNLCHVNFNWQEEYFAVSVSESLVETVRKYIRNQEIHHHKKTWEEEYQELIKKFGFKKFG